MKSQYVYFMDLDELRALVVNARWFTCYFVLSKEIAPGRYRVKTNYRWIQST